MQYFELASGYKMPALGLGTWQLRGSTCTKAVRAALKLGYDHIDTADMYGNHQAIRQALQGVDTDRIFVTSKVGPADLRHDDLLKMGNRALSELGVDHLDLLLIHWPNRQIPISETMAAMTEWVQQGKVRSIGVSNFTVRDLQEAQQVTKVPISVNQVKFHPYNHQRDLLNYCNDHGILVTAYSPFGNGSLVGDRKLKRIASKYDRSFAQIVLRWLVSKGVVVIPKSTNPIHLADNMDIFDWELEPEDAEAIEALDR
jgi:diketogulonate reductase-like aldo/keto reductase